MLKPLVILFFFLLNSLFVTGQADPAPKYHPPLDIPLVLSANFGEIRPNHFHMGVDFKTNGKEGLSLYAIEDGYVARIKTSPSGYGKVLYINHPNGVTSVYAHCSRFDGAIESYVESVQFKEETTEIDIYLTENDLPVRKGQRIALSGNTGNSSGPHLHFELRDTKSEDALNPLNHGFNIADHKAPLLKSINLYFLNDKGYTIPGKSRTLPLVKTALGYTAQGGGFILDSDICRSNESIGFALNGSDTYDGASNACGLYETQLKLNDTVVFTQKIDRISFDHTRYVNTYTDYEAYQQAKSKYHKSFKTDLNPLSIYPVASNGLISLLPGDSLNLNYCSADVAGNKSSVSFYAKRLKGKQLEPIERFPAETYFMPDSSYTYENSMLKVHIDRGTFYEPTKKNLVLKSPVTIGDAQQPIQLPIQIELKLPDPAESKYYIEVRTRNGKKIALKSTRLNGWIKGESLYLGTFYLQKDILGPKITPLNFDPTKMITAKLKLTFSVLETGSGIYTYDAFIDGKWFPLEYESKGGYMFFNIPSDWKGQEKIIRIECTDHCQNKSQWESPVRF
jgi:hypothetical protein